MAVMSRTLVCLLLTGAAAMRQVGEGENTAVVLDDGIMEKPLAMQAMQPVSMSADFQNCYEACDCDHLADPGISVSSKCPPCLRELGMHFTRHGSEDNEARDAYCAQKTYTETTTTTTTTTIAATESTSDCNSACDCENFDMPALSVETKCKPCLEQLGEHINHQHPLAEVRESYCAPMRCNLACDCGNLDMPSLSIETECKPCLEKLGNHINHKHPLAEVRDSYCESTTTTTTETATTMEIETTTTSESTTTTTTTTTITTTTTTMETETTTTIITTTTIPTTSTSEATTTTTTTTIATTPAPEATTTVTSTSGARHLLIHASLLMASLMSLILLN